MTGTNGDPTPERLAELERENARLQAELNIMRAWTEVEHQMLDAVSLRELPLTDEDLRRVADHGPSISDLIAEVEREIGSGGRS